MAARLSRCAVRRPEQGPCGAAATAGFTLIETVAVMAIFGLLLAVVLPSLPLTVSRPQAEGLATRVAAILEGDRSAALRRHVAVSSRADAGGRTIASGAGGPSLVLPAGVLVRSTLAKSCLGRAIQDRIVFLPDGTSCGGSIMLGDRDRWVVVSVNWLTGSVDVAARPRS